jgi:CheY-like chemotaxis protein
LVRRMMELHGGSIDVTSEQGVGSTFICRFDGAVREMQQVQKPDRPAKPQKALAVKPADVSRSLLIVDENTINRKLAFNALRSKGYEISQASSGEETLTLLRDTRFDLVLMDLQLPDIDGLELVRRLEADPHTAGLAVVALSASDDPELKQTVLANGCIGFIAKPIRLATFPAVVEEYLERQLTPLN